MHAPPLDLDPTELTRALRQSWALDVGELDYLPVGFGSHHWTAVTDDGERYFVTVNDLDARRDLAAERDTVADILEAAFATSADPAGVGP